MREILIVSNLTVKPFMIAIKIRRLFYSYITLRFFIMFSKFLNAYKKHKKYYKTIAETTNLIF